MVDSYSFRDILHGLRNVFAKRITDEQVAKGSGVAVDVAAGVAFALRVLRPSSQAPPLTLFTLKDVINLDSFTQLLRQNNASSSEIQSILESVVQLPSTVFAS